MIGKYYLYRHIRLDKNEPFYIGIGTKILKACSDKHLYKRAFEGNNRRNSIWNLISSKTKHQVEILLESDDYDFIKQKEIEFIKFYGRIDNNTGILSNFTDGGEGNLNINYNKERALKISKGNKGRIKSKSEIELIRENGKRKVVHKETGEVFNSIMEAAKNEGITSCSLYQKLWTNAKSCKFEYFNK